MLTRNCRKRLRIYICYFAQGVNTVSCRPPSPSLCCLLLFPNNYSHRLVFSFCRLSVYGFLPLVRAGRLPEPNCRPPGFRPPLQIPLYRFGSVWYVSQMAQLLLLSCLTRMGNSRFHQQLTKTTHEDTFSFDFTISVCTVLELCSQRTSSCKGFWYDLFLGTD